MANRPLVMIPTYNERENAEPICEEIVALPVEVDLLFIDDNSPDGTGEVLDRLAAKHPRVRVCHRSGKQGIGSAHKFGIRWAYDNGYDRLVTLDCDYTHPPSHIPEFLRLVEDTDIVVGSRYLQENSLSEWNLYRKTLTLVGHFLTEKLLKMPHDATGAFRAYRLDRIPQETFDLVRSQGYSFFFESLFVLCKNNHSVRELPVSLPARTYGHSKMRMSDAVNSLRQLFELYMRGLIEPQTFKVMISSDPGNSASAWNSYWSRKANVIGALYDAIAAPYRKYIIRLALNRAAAKHFKPGAALLHAGCGGGEVDIDLNKKFQISALDISPVALDRYAKVNSANLRIVEGSILELPFPDSSFDGIYNLGVMEHFTKAELQRILIEFRRVLKQDGTVLLFWPPQCTPSGIVLSLAHRFLNEMLRSSTVLHPPEISRIRSREDAASLLKSAGLTLKEYSFGAGDAFTHCVIAARKEQSLV